MRAQIKEIWFSHHDRRNLDGTVIEHVISRRLRVGQPTTLRKIFPQWDELWAVPVPAVLPAVPAVLPAVPAVLPTEPTETPKRKPAPTPKRARSTSKTGGLHQPAPGTLPLDDPECLEYARRICHFRALEMIGKAGFSWCDVEDLEQDLFFRILYVQNKFDGRKGRWSTFCNRVLKNHSINMLAFRYAQCRDFRLVTSGDTPLREFTHAAY
jgi:hypothetical protein